MKRMDLSSLTPEEVKARKAAQADARKKKQRAKEKEEREMAKKKAMLTPISPEVIELIEELRGLKFRAMIEPIAFWERETGQRLPLPRCIPIDGESPAEFQERSEHHRQIVLAAFYSGDFYSRQKAADRKKVFDAKEAREARRLGITVFELQKRRKIAASIEAKKTNALHRVSEKKAA